MRDILPDLDSWCANNYQTIAIATVIQTWGSSPRCVGAKMAMLPSGKITGSVSGGCVEGAVFEVGLDVLQTNKPQLLDFGVADESAWDVGLACGGSIRIIVKPLDIKFFSVLKPILLAQEQPAVMITIIRGSMDLLGREMFVHHNGKTIGTLNDKLDVNALNLAMESLTQGISRRAMLNEDVEVFLDVFLPPLTLIAVGGVSITIALMILAKTLGYRTVIIDPRKTFGNAERFPNVDQLIQLWPDEALQQVIPTPSTAIAMLTHDPKLDDSALKIALRSSAFYVGALGSRATQSKRRERLLNDGLTEMQLDRLHGPIGLAIEAHSPEEIALSIMAEIVAIRNKASHFLK